MEKKVLGIPSRYVFRSLNKTLKHLNNELKGIDVKLLSLVKKDQQKQLTLLQTIPGIGQKTAMFLIVVTDGFKKFETASQLCSYAGITPVIKSRIRKQCKRTCKNQ